MIEAGDVVQIVPESEVRGMFYGKLAFVDEVTNWGIKAHIETFEGDVHLRLPTGSYERVGPAPFIAQVKEE